MGWKSAAAAIALLLDGGLTPELSQGAQLPPKHHVAAPQPPARIACTVLGCMPIPAACMPVAGKTPGGIPTGYDVIACPPGVWPFH